MEVAVTKLEAISKGKTIKPLCKHDRARQGRRPASAKKKRASRRRGKGDQEEENESGNDNDNDNEDGEGIQNDKKDNKNTETQIDEDETQAGDINVDNDDNNEVDDDDDDNDDDDKDNGDDDNDDRKHRNNISQVSQDALLHALTLNGPMTAAEVSLLPVLAEERVSNILHFLVCLDGINCYFLFLYSITYLCLIYCRKTALRLPR